MICLKKQKLYLTNLFKLCIIIIGNGETTNVVCQCKVNTSTPPSEQMCFLLVYSLLLKITANAIIKAIAMIVTPINE